MEIKQYVTKQSMDHRRNQRGNQKTSRDKWHQKHGNPNSVSCHKSSSKRDLYSNTILPQEMRKISSKQPKLIHKATREKNKQNLTILQKERSHKDQSSDK